MKNPFKIWDKEDQEKNKLLQKNLALHARIITEDMAFIAAFDAVRNAYMDKLIKTRHNEKELREYYHQCVNALEDVKNTLTIYLQNGKLLEKELKKKTGNK